MNLWRQLEQRMTSSEASKETEVPSTPFMPKLDFALQASAAVARVLIDARLWFVVAIGVAILVQGRKGDFLTGLLVLIGCVLVYRADRWRRIPQHLRLLSWADLNKPLLRRLSLEAPGTYAHTSAVANLAEAACNTIGADGLLARIGMYYHDIGKLRRPQHFIENQPRGRNPHDKLKPSMSATIIRNHVKEGLELAEEYGLPRELRPFISEHHGTLPISYFLEKARERDGTVNPADYMYPGPLPQSVETAVCMLADGVEARVRSLHDPTPALIAEGVDAIIQRRLEDGQLREAPITLRQLSMVRDQFVRILTGMYHGRVEYPAMMGRTLSITPSSRASA